jgi:inosine/xanthosine triphosphatase
MRRRKEIQLICYAPLHLCVFALKRATHTIAGMSFTNRIIIAVGSQNPVKVQAVQSGASLMLGEVETAGVQVDSGVRAQPMGDEEMIAGAKQRAHAALAAVPDAAYGVGLEGGCSALNEELFAGAWCVAVNRAGVVGMASTGQFELPPRVAELVRGGMELGHADDLVHGRTNSKQTTGSIGILTHGKYVRAQFYTPAVMMAFIKFVNEGMF